MRELATTALQCERKQMALQTQWPAILQELVQEAVTELWDPKAFATKHLQELEKG